MERGRTRNRRRRVILTDGGSRKPGDGKVLVVEMFRGLLVLVFLKENVQSRDICSFSRLFSKVKQNKHSGEFGEDSSEMGSNPTRF